ncbi:MAG: ATP-binding cassette domain-containing protein [Candidatus Omnitrophota bacterium]|jgi:molybdate transport system ATP-binding protein
MVYKKKKLSSVGQGMEIYFDIVKKQGAFLLGAQGQFDDNLTGIFGPSGCGKTTLLKCLSGFLTPDKGEIRLGGETCFSSSRGINIPLHLRPVGIVFQEPLLFPHMTVKRNIMYGVNPHIKQDYLHTVIDLLGLRPLLGNIPGQLSTGEQKRVALARVLIHRPKVLLMDEPLESLDYINRYQILYLLKTIYRETGIPIVYVSHVISELVALVKKVFVMSQGHAVAYQSPAEIALNQSMGGGGDYENIYELPVLERQEAQGFIKLNFGGYALTVCSGHPSIKPRYKVGIKARDIIVAEQPVTRMSARNCVPAVVQEVSVGSCFCRVLARAGTEDCVLELTLQAVRDLDLRRGKKVFLIIKAMGISLYESGSR